MIQADEDEEEHLSTRVETSSPLTSDAPVTSVPGRNLFRADGSPKPVWMIQAEDEEDEERVNSDVGVSHQVCSPASVARLRPPTAWIPVVRDMDASGVGDVKGNSSGVGGGVADSYLHVGGGHDNAYLELLRDLRVMGNKINGSCNEVRVSAIFRIMKVRSGAGLLIGS